MIKKHTVVKSDCISETTLPRAVLTHSSGKLEILGYMFSSLIWVVTGLGHRNSHRRFQPSYDSWTKIRLAGKVKTALRETALAAVKHSSTQTVSTPPLL